MDKAWRFPPRTHMATMCPPSVSSISSTFTGIPRMVVSKRSSRSTSTLSTSGAVGLVDDCGRLVVKTFVTNGSSAPCTCPKGPDLNRAFAVSPLIAGNRDRFVRLVEAALRQCAGVP